MILKPWFLGYEFFSIFLHSLKERIWILISFYFISTSNTIWSITKVCFKLYQTVKLYSFETNGIKYTMLILYTNKVVGFFNFLITFLAFGKFIMTSVTFFSPQIKKSLHREQFVIRIIYLLHFRFFIRKKYYIWIITYNY